MTNEGVVGINYLTEIIGQSFPIIQMLFFTVLIVIYALFVFFFYKYLARKNIVDLNLKRYNHSANPEVAKFLGFIFYILEYLILLPIITIFWFGIITLLLLVIAKNIDMQTILIVAAALITSVRITSYLNKNLSQDLAKMIPFTILTLALIGENFFSMERLLTRIFEIPSIIHALPQFIVFIISVELILRTIELIKKLIIYGDDIDEEIEPLE